MTISRALLPANSLFGFQYCAVLSMTAFSTPYWHSQADRCCNSAEPVPNRRLCNTTSGFAGSAMITTSSFLMNVNSCYILRHILTFPAREARSARARQIRTVPCFDLPEPGRYEHTYPLQPAFRIRLAYGLDCSKAVSTSFAPAPVELMPHLERFSFLP